LSPFTEREREPCVPCEREREREKKREVPNKKRSLLLLAYLPAHFYISEKSSGGVFGCGSTPWLKLLDVAVEKKR
jgi:hypothetical protein